MADFKKDFPSFRGELFKLKLKKLITELKLNGYPLSGEWEEINDGGADNKFTLRLYIKIKGPKEGDPKKFSFAKDGKDIYQLLKSRASKLEGVRWVEEMGWVWTTKFDVQTEDGKHYKVEFGLDIAN